MNERSKASVLFLGKRDDEHCAAALAFVRNNFAPVNACLGAWGDPLPDISGWSGDYIVSYLSRWVVPAELIPRAKIAAINFHPGPLDYPGIGCNNFALYDDAEEYGVTCHFLGSKVDVGDIIATRQFPIFASDDVASLLSRTYAFQLSLFYEVAAGMVKGEVLAASGEKWGRTPFTRSELNALAIITPDMSPNEIARRIRATRFGPWKPKVRIGDFEFEIA